MLTTLTPCEADGAAFFADLLDPSYFHESQEAGADPEREHDMLATVVDDTVGAIRACQSCPLLKSCREGTLAQIDSGCAPAGVVQAGVYWGMDQRPDFTLNGTVDAASAAQAHKRSGYVADRRFRVDDNGRRWPMTVAVYTTRPTTGSTSLAPGPVAADLGAWDVSWIPSLPDPINEAAVNLAVEGDSWPRVIPQAKADARPELVDEGMEILTDSEACEAIRRLSRKGASVRHIALRLFLSPGATKDIMKLLGLPVPHCAIRSQRAKERERRHAIERAEQKRQAAIIQQAKRAEQQRREAIIQQLNTLATKEKNDCNGYQTTLEFTEFHSTARITAERWPEPDYLTPIPDVHGPDKQAAPGAMQTTLDIDVSMPRSMDTVLSAGAHSPRERRPLQRRRLRTVSWACRAHPAGLRVPLAGRAGGPPWLPSQEAYPAGQPFPWQPP